MSDETREAVAAIRKVLLVHSGEEFTADDFPTFEDGQAAWEALARLSEAVTQAERVINCEHARTDSDDPRVDDLWAYVEHEGKTWHRCRSCGLAELWEGDIFVRASLGGMADDGGETCECGHLLAAHNPTTGRRECRSVVYTNRPLGAGAAYSCPCLRFAAVAGEEQPA